MADISSQLFSMTRWGRELRFGNLIKQGRDFALYWYTVELGREVFAFDAQAVAERISGRGADYQFSADAQTSVEQAATLAEQGFATFEEFAKWVRTHFHRVEVAHGGLPLDIERLSRALAEPFVAVPQGLSREAVRQFIIAQSVDSSALP
jgi:hypothetical protein